MVSTWNIITLSARRGQVLLAQFHAEADTRFLETCLRDHGQNNDGNKEPC